MHTESMAASAPAFPCRAPSSFKLRPDLEIEEPARWKRSAAYWRHRPAGRGPSRSSSTEHRPGPGGTASQNLCSEPATTPATYGPASADSHYADGLVEATANRRALERWSGRCRASIRRTAEIEARRYDG